MKNSMPFIWLCVIVAAFFGWCMNIVTIVKDTPELAHWGVMEVMRVIGVFFAPLGALLGWV